ncbi:MAG TPA: hypothetical protein PKL49_01025 [Steroidobacteraceae bacterium]|nr:hypothetical protein [Steroidobacteraceae bacterium]
MLRFLAAMIRVSLMAGRTTLRYGAGGVNATGTNDGRAVPVTAAAADNVPQCTVFVLLSARRYLIFPK